MENDSVSKNGQVHERESISYRRVVRSETVEVNDLKAKRGMVTPTKTGRKGDEPIKNPFKNHLVNPRTELGSGH